MSNINYMLLNDDENHQSDGADNEDLCVICYDHLDCPEKPKYSLPECEHTFHQSCVNAWFRQGNQKCPLCNDVGTGNTHHSPPFRPWQHKFNSLRRLSKKKNAPTFLVKNFEKVKKREDAIKILKDEFKEWKDKEIIIDGQSMKNKDLLALGEKKQRQCRTREWNLRSYKRRLFEGMNIVPLILVEKKKI